MAANPQLDQFVEKVVIKNNLVPADNLQKAKALHTKHPDLSLLDVLIRTKLLGEKHAALIHQKYQSQSGTMDDSDSVFPSQQFARKYIDRPESRQSSDEQPKKVAHSLTGTESLEAYLIEARNQGASDLYINVNSPPIIRFNGRLEFFDRDPFTPEETETLLFDGLPDKYHEILKEEWANELCLDYPDHGRYRSCFLKQRLGWEGSFHIINQEIPTFESLGLPEHIKQFTDYTQGLVLVTGPSGSGKSSSLAAMINQINQKRAEHIITLEDPIEFKYKPIKSHISQREVGSHTKNFSNALRAALREDPDVILVGELRDFETASLAVTAAETGHLVFSTLHTIDAAQTVMRLLDFFPPNQQNQIRAMVSESLRGIVCQRLIPRADNQGRALALEIMFNVPSISSLIRDDKLFQIKNMMRINQTKGMNIMDNSIKELLEKKLINTEEAHFAMVDNLLFQEQKTSRI